MASLTIKGIPEELMEHLRRRAEQHRRSLNSEVLHLLERSVVSTIIDPEAVIERVHRLQERTRLTPLTEDMLAEAVDQGRP